MTREDVQDFLSMMSVMYENFRPVDKTATVNYWYIQLKDYDTQAMTDCLMIYGRTNTSGFAPKVSNILEIYNKVKTPDELDELSAWDLVMRAIRNSAYNSKEEFAKLPEPVQKALRTPDVLRTWATDEHFKESVASSNFMRTYANVIERERFLKKVPPGIQEKFKNLLEDNTIMIGDDRR